MSKMNRILVTLGLVMVTTIALSFSSDQDDPWKVPEKYQKLENPVVADDASINSGKQLYSSYCLPCHGKDS